MQELINEAILPMIEDGLISMDRVRLLIDIKEFIDRVATKHFIEEEDVTNLQKKYGVRPNIISWGDYFQTDLASALLVVSDEEFQAVLDTIKFDVISSYIIFSEKEEDFFQWVDYVHTDVTKQPRESYSEEEEEILHLKVLKDYFVNMKIQDRFTEGEMQWYNTYREAMAV